jgi:quercetin dioxygenase-like cupin family protein
MKTYALKRAAELTRTDFDWGHLTWFASGPNGNSDHQTVGRCVIKPGCANPRHYHPNCEEVLHVLAGTIEHDIKGHPSVTMHPGDTITIETGVRHQAHNVGPDDAVLMISFSSPDRQTVAE